MNSQAATPARLTDDVTRDQVSEMAARFDAIEARLSKMPSALGWVCLAAAIYLGTVVLNLPSVSAFLAGI